MLTRDDLLGVDAFAIMRIAGHSSPRWRSENIAGMP
jgi:hypothetical protein